MAKFIFSAALTAFLLIATSASADLRNGTSRWFFQDDMRRMGVIVGVSDGNVLAWCAEDCGCLFGSLEHGSRRLLNLVVTGREVTGTILACALVGQLVADCHVKPIYDAQFKGTIDFTNDSYSAHISGKYLADGWAFKDSGGKWTACHPDSDFDEWLDLRLIVSHQEPCGADVVPGILFVTPRSGRAELYQAPSTASPVVSSPPSGMKVVYTQVSTENGEVWYKLKLPGGTPGWYPAADASCTRPIASPPSHPIKPVDPNQRIIQGTMAMTAAARG
jgi:hypothetical protein